MKREAGVTGHEVNIRREDFSGLAFIGTGKIRSPKGENIQRLYILAHECGHIFLHNDPPGIYFPAHVMEMEAESYAHQAFHEHGMELPEAFTEWGRAYVGTWVEKDRSERVAIDPRVEAYVSGERSPYEPLRAVPNTWQLYSKICPRQRIVVPDWARGTLLRPIPDSMRSTRVVAGEMARQCSTGAFWGIVATCIARRLLVDGPYYEHEASSLPVIWSGAVVGACIAVMWRTMTR